MSRINLYIHYDSVTNHIMTRGINLLSADFEENYIPNHMILADAPAAFGRFDAQTNFKILRGQREVIDYLDICHGEGMQLSNWIDFESISAMHNLTPNEIAEILYLFHASNTLRSAFFYKLQNNYVFLTLPNGLNKMYYRHAHHFYPRFRRVLRREMGELINEGRNWFFMKKEKVSTFPQELAERIAPLFVDGLKINFSQASLREACWYVPLDIIEDELTLLTQSQVPSEHVGHLIYNTQTQLWVLEISMSENDY